MGIRIRVLSVFTGFLVLVLGLQFVWATAKPQSPYTPGNGHPKLTGWPFVATLQWYSVSPSGELLPQTSVRSPLGHVVNLTTSLSLAVLCTLACGRMTESGYLRFSIRQLLCLTLGAAIAIVYLRVDFSLMKFFSISTLTHGEVQYTNFGRPASQRVISALIASISVLGLLELRSMISRSLAYKDSNSFMRAQRRSRNPVEANQCG